MKKWIFSLFLIFSSSCFAATNCESLLEITCDSDKCETTESFTPMSITIAKKTIEVCAYSGCWEGAYTRKDDRRISMYVARKMKWNGPSPNPADSVITLDASDNRGQLKILNFMVPLKCQISTPKS